MRLAVLIRGIHWMNSDRFGFPLDARRHVDSLLRNVVAPLRAAHAVDIFCITYDSPIRDELMAMISPSVCRILDQRTSDQLLTFAEGLRLVAEAGAPYDRVICTRFDLSYLTSIDRWNVWHDRRGVFLPWREYEHSWLAERRVGDAIHVCDDYALRPFMAAIEELRTNNQKHLHAIYPVVTKLTPDVHFICDGYHDSNTLFCNRECFNPLYRIANRPRLPAIETFRPPAPHATLTSRRMRRAGIHVALAWSRAVVTLASWISRTMARLLPYRTARR